MNSSTASAKGVEVDRSDHVQSRPGGRDSERDFGLRAYLRFYLVTAKRGFADFRAFVMRTWVTDVLVALFAGVAGALAANRFGLNPSSWSLLAMAVLGAALFGLFWGVGALAFYLETAPARILHQIGGMPGPVTVALHAPEDAVVETDYSPTGRRRFVIVPRVTVANLGRQPVLVAMRLVIDPDDHEIEINAGSEPCDIRQRDEAAGLLESPALIQADSSRHGYLAFPINERTDDGVLQAEPQAARRRLVLEATDVRSHAVLHRQSLDLL